MNNLPTILYEDEAVLVLNKPAGITVNKSDTTRNEVTLQEWIEIHLHLEPLEKTVITKELSYDSVFTFQSRAGIVHRLDKETSGVIVVAKTQEAFVELQRQFKERIVKKTYIALAHGVIQPKEGIITVPVGRLPWNRKRFGVLAGGREAVTRYKIISNSKFLFSNEQFTLVELYPETGRTHQIRVHLKHIGHPIFSDFLYAGRKTAREDRRVLERVFLHAAKISFVHPQTGQEVHFESPLPEELSTILQIHTNPD